MVLEQIGEVPEGEWPVHLEFTREASPIDSDDSGESIYEAFDRNDIRVRIATAQRRGG
ncbi:hypothetical protein AGR8A_pTi10128 [Agrobacterium fabrum str. J-07]|nr:hypothetical protein AGR8A_pTi10128 [Agrobacterium fabrum str. J-07]